MSLNPTNSETAKYRHLVERYCWQVIATKAFPAVAPMVGYTTETKVPGCGVDIGSQGDPVVPWAWSFDLPQEQFLHYNSGYPARGPIQLRGDCHSLPVDNESLDFVYASHLLEDFVEWLPLLKEWVRVIKPGGYLILLVPDRNRFQAALAAGQPPNDAHRHESFVSELSSYAPQVGITVIEDRFTDLFEGDYTILFVGQK